LKNTSRWHFQFAIATIAQLVVVMKLYLPISVWFFSYRKQAMQWADRIGRRVKLRDLHVLLAVAQSGSMSGAAERLAVSYPVVSKTMSDLEHTLGVRLLERSSRGVEPTMYGRALLECGVAVFDDLRLGMKKIEFLSDPTSGELRIGSIEPLMAGFIPAILDRLTRQYPRIALHVVQADAATLCQSLRDRDIDLVVARSLAPEAEHGFATEFLFDERLFVVAGKQNPWARRRKIELAELINDPWILPPAESVVGSLIEDAFRANGLKVPKLQIASLSVHLRDKMLGTGRFLSVLAGSMLHFSGRRLSIQVLPVDLPVNSRPIEILTLKNRAISPVADLFIGCAREVAKPIVRNYGFPVGSMSQPSTAKPRSPSATLSRSQKGRH
jgi:DNA-binding transcriptional LysR family regulator